MKCITDPNANVYQFVQCKDNVIPVIERIKSIKHNKIQTKGKISKMENELNY